MKKFVVPLAMVFGLGVIAPAFADTTTSTPPPKSDTEKKDEKAAPSGTQTKPAEETPK